MLKIEKLHFKVDGKNILTIREEATGVRD